MNTRGEKTYIDMPRFAAKMYDMLTGVKGVMQGFEDVANFLDTFIKEGKLLDIGNGPGKLLAAIHRKIPNLELFGIDISVSMVDIARRNLRDTQSIDLRVGNISKSGFPDGYFDCMVSTGSFYNWDSPVECLNEMYRILKSGKTAYIFDTYKDHDPKLLHAGLERNLSGYGLIRKNISKRFLLKQLGMTYTLSEFDEIAKQSDFKNTYEIELTELGNLPIYVRLVLKKIV
jgi:ubiquinone/menaquinone biosynthesis C-methylase UbiE